MSLKNFRAYQISIQFYWECEKLKLSRHLQDQLLRASSSIALNLSEGSAKPTDKDRKRFYFFALGSIRECETVLDLAKVPDSAIVKALINQLGASVFNLCKSKTPDTNHTRPRDS